LAEVSHLQYSRVHVQVVNQNKIRTIFDFAYGEYLAHKEFFDELSRVQSQLLSDGTVTLKTGQEASIDTPGGLIAIQFYIETLETARQSMQGMSKLGLQNENKLWQLQ
jgi:hypothetical protein